jgi:hypothetical protein
MPGRWHFNVKSERLQYELVGLNLHEFLENPEEKDESTNLEELLEKLQNPSENRELAKTVVKYFTSTHCGRWCREWNNRNNGVKHEKSSGFQRRRTGKKWKEKKWEKLAKKAAREHSLCLSCFLLMCEELGDYLNQELKCLEILSATNFDTDCLSIVTSYLR